VIICIVFGLGLLTVIGVVIFMSARRHAPATAGVGIDARRDAKRRVSREARRARGKTARQQRKRNRGR
jgi:hypothetical protein